MDDNDRTGRQALIEGVAAAIALLALVAVVPTVWLIIAFNNEFRQCVPLKNGLKLGYPAVFDLSRPLLEPIVVLKYPDGTPLTLEEMWNFEATDTSVFGVSYAKGSNLMHEFAWRADTGFVLRAKDPATYEILYAEARTTTGNGIDAGVDEGALYERLLGQIGVQNERCPTALVTW